MARGTQGHQTENCTSQVYTSMASRVDRYCAQLAQFATQFMDGTAAEVRAGAGASAKDVADSLDAAISLVKCHAPAGSLDAAVGPAETVRSECWRQLSEGSGWPNVGWREAYGFALMTLALVHVQRHEATLKRIHRQLQLPF